MGGGSMRNAPTGSMGRYSFMAGHDSDMFRNLYHSLKMSSSEMDNMPSQAAEGASMADQAKAAGYKDIFRNIQAMRDSGFKKQEKEGAISPEFSGTIRRPGNLGGGFWFSS